MARKIRSLPRIPARRPDAHKGTFGRVGVVGGSLGMTGAVHLAGRGALLCGAGLVDLLVPERVVDIVASRVLSLMVRHAPSDRTGAFAAAAGRAVSRLTADATAVAVGPGMGTGRGARAVVTALLASRKGTLVIDADALNCLALDGCRFLAGTGAQVVLTPHPGEMARLTGMTIAEVQAERIKTATAFAARHRVVTVLKGHGTVVTDGSRYYVNPTGNPGMAVGGSGDVLTGMIAGLAAASGLALFEAACLGVHLHGHAGDIAARAKGQISMTAEDILDAIHLSFRKSTT